MTSTELTELGICELTLGYSSITITLDCYGTSSEPGSRPQSVYRLSSLKNELDCPACETHYTDFVRDSINLNLGEEWTEADIAEATSTTCPNCGQRTDHNALIIEIPTTRTPGKPPQA